MAVKIKGISSLQKKLKTLEQSYSDKAALKMAAMGMTLVKEHTLKGQDESRRTFVKYNPKGKKSGRVDLFDKGNMFRAMNFKKSGKGKAIIYFTRTEEAIKAFAHHNGFKGNVKVKAHRRVQTQAFGKKIAPRTNLITASSRDMNLPKRAFFGLQPNESKKLKTLLESIIDKAIKK